MNDATNVENELKAGRAVIVFTKGTSMRPLIYEGKSHVLAEPVKREPKRGDLPLYKHPKRGHTYVIHRLIAVKENYYITRGDNCLNAEKIPKESVLGIVTKIYRGNREISVEAPGYRAYVLFWRVTTPFRLAFFYLKGKCFSFLRRVKRLLTGKSTDNRNSGGTENEEGHKGDA